MPTSLTADANIAELVQRFRDNALGVVLFLLVEDYESRFLQAYRRLGFDDVRRSHGAVLRHLDGRGATMSLLSQRAGLTKQTIGKIVRQLEQLGYLTVAVSADDRRARLVRISARGEQLVSASNRVVETIRRHYRQRLGEAAFDALYRQLDRATRELGVQPRYDSSPQRFLHFGRLLVELAGDFERRLFAVLPTGAQAILNRPVITQLYQLGQGGMTISELAQPQALTVQAVSLTVRQMAARGLVSVRECHGDSRAKRVALSPAGQVLLGQLGDGCAGVRADYARVLGADTLSAMELSLRNLHDALREPSPA